MSSVEVYDPPLPDGIGAGQEAGFVAVTFDLVAQAAAALALANQLSNRAFLLSCSANAAHEAVTKGLSETDTTTGLLNQGAFLQRILPAALEAVRYERANITVVGLDVWGLKEVNRTKGLGHPAGTDIIVAQAKALRDCTRVHGRDEGNKYTPPDTVAFVSTPGRGGLFHTTLQPEGSPSNSFQTFSSNELVGRTGGDEIMAVLQFGQKQMSPDEWRKFTVDFTMRIITNQYLSEPFSSHEELRSIGFRLGAGLVSGEMNTIQALHAGDPKTNETLRAKIVRHEGKKGRKDKYDIHLFVDETMSDLVLEHGAISQAHKTIKPDPHSRFTHITATGVRLGSAAP